MAAVRTGRARFRLSEMEFSRMPLSDKVFVYVSSLTFVIFLFYQSDGVPVNMVSM
jgi:hypothetical protein